MQKFTKLHSLVIPLAKKDVDTDMIIPAQYLTKIDKSGYGKYLFIRLKEADSEFVFNKDKYKDAKIMLTSSSFGCGSSREHAIWAFQQSGISVIIASSFADIFFNNAAKNGLLLIQLEQDIIDDWLIRAKDGNFYVTVDLVNQQVIAKDNEIHHFDYDAFRKKCLIKGQDDLDYLLEHLPEIIEYEQKECY